MDYVQDVGCLQLCIMQYNKTTYKNIDLSSHANGGNIKKKEKEKRRRKYSHATYKDLCNDNTFGMMVRGFCVQPDRIHVCMGVCVCVCGV